MPKTLLLADDSVTIQKVVGISFANEDVEIITVDNGDDAIERARTLRPDVILADVVMPGLSGYEVCEAVKADASLRHIPVLLLTGTFEAFDATRAETVGAAGHVSKPFEAQTLVDRVMELLDAPAALETDDEIEADAVEELASDSSAARGSAPESASSTDTYDFFNDADPVETGRDESIADSALDFDGPDGAFAFGDDDFAPAQEPRDSAVEPREAPVHDATVTMFLDRQDDAAGADDLDLALEADAPETPMRPDQLAHTALLDPVAGADLDVSSSDLAVDLTSGPGGAAPGFDSFAGRAPAPVDFGDDPFALPVSDDASAGDLDDDMDLTEPDEPYDDEGFARPAALPRDPIMDMLSPRRAPPAPPVAMPEEPIAAAPTPVEATPAEATPIEPTPAAPTPIEPTPAEATPRPWSVTRDADEAPLGEFAMAPPPIPDTTPIPEPPPVPRAALATPPPVRESAAAAPSTELTPAMRQELRDTLEKIAWDAFGQTTEKIVREAIECMERVAWEVVPRLAETIIQEEIRRLKEGGSGE